MEKEKRIAVEQCCSYYSIELSFVQQLDEHGLIELNRSGKETFIAFEQLPDLEKYIRLYYELEINMAGIEAVTHLLNRVQGLQQEVKRLQGEMQRHGG
ncbi:MAG TPA: chaperone modulator CbpM [Parapedobacter sp.]|uniref:chaperone modulator CbpM n=1 Tax=Parapedobacter sp. TaxID=1958893 RepID=UPI002C0F294A|nr:chaperone modulator CbpM [Parapedobacter sp.]HWK59469.1 chaperone modulator CbpM [Parapedobacter sp.]